MTCRSEITGPFRTCPMRHGVLLNLLGIVTVLKPSLGYKQRAEIARGGYETGKSLHQIVVEERKLLTQEK